jgi:hypothetical protein
MRCAPGRGRRSRGGAPLEVVGMLPRIRICLIGSPIVALTVQLLLAAASAASTGGGDFPRFRVLLTFL